MLQETSLAERRSGVDRRTGSDRRRADAEAPCARIIRSIDRDRRSDEDRRQVGERRRFEKVVVRMRQLRGELARLSRSRDDS
jgi:hypothetical protein